MMSEQPLPCRLRSGLPESCLDYLPEREGLGAGSRLAEQREWIGDVRGCGLVFGAEIVTDRATKAPAAACVARVAKEVWRRDVLLHRLHERGASARRTRFIAKAEACALAFPDHSQGRPQ
jgi:hypothetical protein